MFIKETNSAKDSKYESTESDSLQEKIRRDNRENESLNVNKSRFIVKSRVTSRNANTLFLLLRIFLESVAVIKKLIIIFLIINSVSGFTQQKFAIEPQDQVSQFFTFVLLIL